MPIHNPSKSSINNIELAEQYFNIIQHTAINAVIPTTKKFAAPSSGNPEKKDSATQIFQSATAHVLNPPAKLKSQVNIRSNSLDFRTDKKLGRFHTKYTHSTQIETNIFTSGIIVKAIKL